MARFFINRPVFALVIAILISVGGTFALVTLPVESYPTVAPPQVQISTTYPGADAQTVENTVTQVIEQELKAIDGLLYFTSSSNSNGSATITLTFETGTDADTAVVQTQARVAQAEPRLPSEVIRQGVTVQKVNPAFLMVLTMSAGEGSDLDVFQLNDFVATQVVEPLQRLPGVGLVLHFGGELGMRIWLNPEKLQAYGLSAAHVLDMVRAQNVQFASGAIGTRPALEGQQFQATVVTEGRFSVPAEFENIILRADPDGATVRLKDVARIEFGPQTYSFEARGEGPRAAFAIQTLPNANALEVGETVRAKMDELAQSFPPGVSWRVAFDTTEFISIAIKEVVYTLIEAVVLVFLVMLLFLQSFRATLIPTVVVPVALLGAALGMYALGFSINQLTLFAMVLAIGIVVDDAIVVIEATERIMREEKLPPLEATRKAMGQITNAIIAITVVLSAVFIPAALQSGTVGGIYRQFALVIAVSMVFSAFLALSLTPALCATILRPTHLDVGVFRWFNRTFERSRAAYIRTLATSLRNTPRWMASFAVLVVMAGFLYLRLPTSFVPDEDLGMVFGVVELPPGSTLERTMDTLEKVDALVKQHDAVGVTNKVGGFSFMATGESNGQIFTGLKHWDERDQTAQEFIQWTLTNVTARMSDARVLFISPPTITGLGQIGGFDFYLQDRAGQGRAVLDQSMYTLLQEAAKDPKLMQVRPNAAQPAPRLKVTVDRVQAQALGVNVADVYTAIQLMLAPVYANDFIYAGRVRRVMLQADAPYRMTSSAFNDFYLPSTQLGPDGQPRMIPLSNLVKTEWEVASPTLYRFNGYPAVQITGQAAPGSSSGEAMDAMERLVREKLPRGMSADWAGQSLQERISGIQAPLLFATSLLIVFLCLAALYESWSTPIAVMLIVPLGLLGAALAVTLRGLPNDVFFKIGLITIIGLAAKNAILIVEFAIAQQAEGKSLYEAVLEASRLRLRPILMTSFAFILGVFPLVVSTGAGANARHAIGTGVVGGMLSAAFLGVLLVPVFYVVVRRMLGDRLDETPANRRVDA